MPRRAAPSTYKNANCPKNRPDVVLLSGDKLPPVPSVAVGCGGFVGISVGGKGVLVGGIGVAEGCTDVLVGGTDVAVGGTGVFVIITGVAVSVGFVGNTVVVEGITVLLVVGFGLLVPCVEVVKTVGVIPCGFVGV